jgi:hypothetical protein
MMGVRLKTADVIGEASRLREELRTFDATTANALSADGFLREALGLANISQAQAAELRRRLETEAMHHPASTATVRSLVKLIAERRMLRPPRDPARLSFLLTPEARSELAALSVRPEALVAVAVLIAHEKHPDVFGAIDDWDRHTARLDGLKQRLEELRAPLREERARLTAEIARIDAALAEM